MGSENQFLQKSLGGVLRHTMVDLPGDGGRWDTTTAPTVTLLGNGGGEILASTTASLGSILTTAAIASAGKTLVTLNSTGSVARFDRIVLGPNENGQWEWGTVDGIWSGTTKGFTLLDELQYSYSTGRTVKSHDMTITVAASTVGSIQKNCYAEWHYKVDGVERKDHTIFHISLYAPRMSLSAAKFMQEYPRAQRIKGTNQKLDLRIRETWNRVVLPDIARIFHPGAMVSGADAERAHIAKMKEILENEAKNYDAADRYAAEYAHALDQIRDSMVDLDEDGSQGDAEIVRGLNTPRIRRG